MGSRSGLDALHNAPVCVGSKMYVFLDHPSHLKFALSSSQVILGTNLKNIFICLHHYLKSLHLLKDFCSA